MQYCTAALYTEKGIFRLVLTVTAIDDSKAGIERYKKFLQGSSTNITTMYNKVYSIKYQIKALIP